MSYTSTEVKNRYNDKTYKRYTISLRYDSDGELIDRIEQLKHDGYSPTDAFKQLVEKEKAPA